MCDTAGTYGVWINLCTSDVALFGTVTLAHYRGGADVERREFVGDGQNHGIWVQMSGHWMFDMQWGDIIYAMLWPQNNMYLDGRSALVVAHMGG